MFTLSSRHGLWIAGALSALLILTRGHHFAPLGFLPSASWAVFFLIGVYLRPVKLFFMLCALVLLLDWAAVTLKGTSSFCVTPAYALLLPAYGSLWLGGRWFAQYLEKNTQEFDLKKIFLFLVGAVCLSALLAEIFSSGGFYFFSGRFPDPTFAGFIPRLTRYFPAQLSSLSFYVLFGACLHGIFKNFSVWRWHEES